MAVKSTVSEEQLFQAFQYVAGELSASEADCFEQRLQVEPLLFEAVAEATILTSAVLTSKARQTHVTCSGQSTPVRSISRSIAAVVAMACCLVLTVLLSSSHEPETAATNVEDAELLVSTWADSFAEQAEYESEVEDQADQNLDVPDWMLAALTLSEVSDVETSDMPVDSLMPGEMEL